MRKEIKIPKVGENVESVQVAKILVETGDTVEADQTVLELETGKAVVEVPSPHAGKVVQVFLEDGDDVKPGQAILELEVEETESPEKTEESVGELEKSPEKPMKKEEKTKKTPEKSEKDEKRDNSGPKETEIDEKPSAKTTLASDVRLVPASPSTRRFARELGVDVERVKGTGPHGRVSKDDVKRYVRETRSGTGGTLAVPEPPTPDFSQWGPVRIEKMSSIRRQTAGHLAMCHAVIPHVTIHDKADISALEPLRKKYADRAEKQNGKLTMAVMVTKIVASALKRFPKMNASVDMRNNSVVYKEYCHVGIAVATKRGLVVPVIRDVDKKNMVDLAVEITAIAERARNGKLTEEDMRGGTFTVTNLGRVGGAFFTPIINHPEVGILGMGRYSFESDPEGGERRTLLPLSLSFDHRLVDGVDAAAFLNWIIETLKEPLLLSLEG